MTRNLCPTRGGHSINSRVLFVCFQWTLLHVSVLPPHGYLRRATVCHNVSRCVGSRFVEGKCALLRSAFAGLATYRVDAPTNASLTSVIRVAIPPRKQR